MAAASSPVARSSVAQQVQAAQLATAAPYSSSSSPTSYRFLRVPPARVDQRTKNRYNLRVQASSSFGPASSEVSALQVRSPHQQAPIIEFEFIPPDNRPGENDPIPDPQYCTAVSGEKLLRDVMLDNGIELYGPYGKMMNCEGRGMCGTCLVDILEGAELMNKRTPAEPYYLKLRPDSWRLACQATVGDGTNGGKIKVKRRPQKGHPLM